MIRKWIFFIALIVTTILLIIAGVIYRPPKPTPEPTKDPVTQTSSPTKLPPTMVPENLTYTPTPTLTPAPSFTPTAAPTMSPTAMPTVTPTTTETPTFTPTATPRPVVDSLPPMPNLPVPNICEVGIQNITSPPDGYRFDPGKNHIYLEGAAAWPSTRPGKFRKFEIFYLDPNGVPHDLMQSEAPVIEGLLHTQAIKDLVFNFGKPGWFTFGVLGVLDNDNHFPLNNSNNIGCFVRVYLPRPD